MKLIIRIIITIIFIRSQSERYDDDKLPRRFRFRFSKV